LSLSSIECRVARHVSKARHVAIGLALLRFLVGGPAFAQSLGSPPGYREYVSLLGTPTGSLPPLTTYTIAGFAQHSAELLARYGFVSDMSLPLAPDTGPHEAHSLNSFGLTGLMPLGLDGTVSLTLGLSSQHCTGCSGSEFMGAVNGDYRILSTGLNSSNATRFTLAVAGEVGVGHPATGTAWTVDLGFPLAFTVGPEAGLRFIPFVTPGLAYVTANGASNTENVNAVRVVMGGGVSLFNPKSMLGASVGFQYIFVDKTQVQFGVGVSVGGR
jgi:hypothetical protein